eukprot:87373_1
MATTTKLLSNKRRKIAALILFVVLFTKIGIPNILYILQYIECFIKMRFKKRIKYASSTATYRSKVHVYDIDFWLHLNNASYLRHAELARVDYFIRSQLWYQLKANGYGLAFVAVNIRYRRELALFQAFEIWTRPIYWDEYTLIIEQKFVDRKTNFVHAIMYGKYVLVKNGKRVKRSLISGNFDGDGLHTINFYETHQINKAKNGQIELEQKEDELEQKEEDPYVENFLSSSFVNKKKKTIKKSFYNTYDCRNVIPDSLSLWIKCLEQSHHESRRNLLE